MLKKLFFIVTIFSFFCSFSLLAQSQPMWTIDLIGKEKKPEKFENRQLASEKLAEKKFTIIRRVFQNNYTHYNYYFNANNKINAVIENARLAQVDDYSKLLSFYPYTLENTAGQKNELDSVILKATAGILLHDLRNAWIDNMYLLMGKAYFLRKDFDSAAATFQFINYNLFPRKKDEDDSRIVGSTGNAAKGSISIANAEKQNILQKLTAQPPSRNDALIWMARTYIERDDFSAAAGLINILQQDPNLPKRLKDDLGEVNAYWFYRQQIYDSTASYLETSLGVSGNKQDKARSEFLLAQLFEMNGQYDKASIYYNRASIHTTNPLMDIYAQMNNAKMRKGNDPKELDKGIQNLVKLTRKDNFEKYRDILFYAAGELALVKPDTAQAVQLYIKSYQNNESNVTYKNKAFIRLGDIAYEQRKYQQAYNYYDSLQNGDTTLTETIANIQARRTALSKIVERLAIIHREDSLQRIALLPEAERIAFVKKLSKKLRKAKGLKADDSFDQGPMLDFANKTSEPTDLFASSKNSGEWYFYNASIKSKGFSEFKRKWGTRTNTDNWRRKNASSNANSASSQNSGLPGGGLGNMNPDDIDAAPVAIADPKKGNDSKDGQSFDNYGGRNKNLNGNSTESTNGQEEDLSFEGLMSHLPLTPEAMTNSINLHASNLFYLAKLYQNELEDYQIAIETYDSSLLKFPDSLYNGEIHFGMFYCYTKLGNTAKANYYKNILNTNFRDSKSTKMLNNPAALAKPGEKTKEGTNRYQAIYNLFIEGNFQAALQEKIKADSIFGNQYWSPQLLYIEAVYHVKQKNDSIAKDVLGKIISLYPKSKLKPRAEKLIDVLNRRIEIESYLTKLEVKRYPEDSMTVAPERVKLVRNDNNLIRTPKSLPDSLKNIVQPLNKGIPVVSDSGLIVKNAISGPYQFVHANTHQVIMVLDKVDGTYINEGKNAMTRYVGSNFGSQNITISRDAIDNTLALIVFSSFADANEALQFLQKIRRAAPDEISWLPANKYYFILIDSDNLVRMKNSKDLNGYKALLKQQFPSAF